MLSIFPKTKQEPKTKKTKIKNKIEKGGRKRTSVENSIEPKQEKFQGNTDSPQSNWRTKKREMNNQTHIKRRPN